jgi:4-amino-4-deoxy-L-arabinose transferase-like glycosyltransferase
MNKAPKILSAKLRNVLKQLPYLPRTLASPLFWALPVQAILLFWRLDLLEPWGDELFTLDTAPQSLQQIGLIVGNNIHPPLYFYLLHFWIQGPWPGSLLTRMRAMSAIWALLATVLIYLLWLREERQPVQRIFLLLWILSPCLLLYARMARSYTMQLTLALLAIYAAVRWTKQLRDWRRLLAYALASTALLYTHYLPGLAILIATSVTLLFGRGPHLRTRIAAVVGSMILVLVLYLPWLATIHSAVNNWVSAGGYRVGSVLTDQIVRIGYWFVSFGFGETFSTLGFLLGAVMTPVILYGLWRSLALRPDWFGVVVVAAGIGYIGVSRWSGFPFTPARVLFALPFFLILCIRGIHAGFRRSSLIFACLGILYVTAIYAYFSKTGYLNKGYCVPYEEMAAVIRSGSGGQNAVVVLDTYSSIPDPLLNRIPPEVRIILLGGDNSAEAVREAAKGRAVVWFWRHTHDTSPGEFVGRLEEELGQGRHLVKHEFLPYSQPERWALRIVRGPSQPTHFYQLSEMR